MNPRQKSAGFIVIDAKTGEIMSGLFATRDKARARLREQYESFGATFDATGRTAYRDRVLAVHQVKLWPGETYARETYRP